MSHAWTHSWCKSPCRDEAVRAAEDGRDGPLPTLEECIERQKHAAMTAGVKEGFVKADGEWKRLTDEELRQLLVIPKSVSATSAPEQENKRDSMADRAEISRAGQFAPQEARQEPNCTERDSVTDRRPPEPGGGGNVTGFTEPAKCSPAVSETGEGQSGTRTERVSLSLQRMGELIAERDAAIRERDELRKEGERRLTMCERMKEERDQARFHAAIVQARVAELESAPAASGAAGTGVVGSEVVGYAVKQGKFYSERLHSNYGDAWGVAGKGTVVPLYAAPQPAKGWLTEEERGSIWYAIEGLREASSSRNDGHARTLESLLARSSPPEVVLPVSTIGRGERYDGDWIEGWIACRERCAAALAAAGVEWKEVGK